MSKGGLKKILVIFLAVAVLMTALLPQLTFPSFSADGEPDAVFDSGAVLIDSSYNGKNVLIKDGVFSVTVNGATDVNIIFQDVTIDRRYASDTASDGQSGQTIENLYEVSSALGWGTTAQVCPLLITGNSGATVAFRGTNTFYAGVNGCTVSSAGVYTAAQSGGGFAGVQVDSGSSLTIEYGNLSSYGGHYVEGDNSNNYGYGYGYPSGASPTLAGGAGIGGGVTYDTASSYGRDYTQGTPGTITINGGTINAYGGHQAAGIGGGLNGAATSASITINGGDITVCGGRWAAGIGDGDSLQDGYSGDFANSYSINIHGGMVNAIGGVACPGIGSTDSLSAGVSATATSGLEITIDGGKVTALPGYPDMFNPDGTTGYTESDAAAAIGAGNKTNMQSNSISITSDAEILASGFGHYSITENGTSYDARPNVNIDSDGYLYLGRFPDLVDYTSRVFELYEAQTEIIDGKVYCKYVTQPADGSPGAVYYVCAEADKPLLDANREEVIPDGGTTASDYDALFEELRLTLYVDETSALIKSVQVLKHFRSIALSLPKPEEHGGLYALKIPCETLYQYDDSAFSLPESGYITVTVSANDSGTISGELVYPQANNIEMDAVTTPFIDLDVYRDGPYQDGRDGLIGSNFFMNVYAYTVYIENTDNTAYLYGRYIQEENSSGSIDIDDTAVSLGTEDYFTAEVDMTGLKEKVIRIRKTDTVDGNQSNSIIYKITIIRKSVYKIDLKNISKVYDGVQVTPSINEIYAGTHPGYQAVHSIVSQISGSPAHTVTPSGTTLSAAGTYGYYQRANRTASISLNTSCEMDASETGKLVYTVTVEVASVTNATNIVSPDPFVFTVTLNHGAAPTVAGSNASVSVAAYRKQYFNLVPDNTAGTISINYNSTNSVVLFSLSYPFPNGPTATGDESAKQEAEALAEKALAQGATSGEWQYTSFGSEAYSGSVNAEVFKTAFTASTANTNTSSSAGTDETEYTTSAESATTGKYTIEPTGGSADYEAIEVAEEELNSAVYSFYSSTDGGNTWLALSGAPKDAGLYKVSAVIEAESYTASGEIVWNIEKRPIRVLGIANYLRYVTSSEYSTLTVPCPINEPGDFLLENVVADDKGKVIASAVSVYYNDISIGFGQTKVTLDGVVLSGTAAHNYTTEDIQQVPGQISYSMDGAIFRKKYGLSWDKFYPIDSPDPVSSATADYHSPINNGVYDAHADYVYARTTGQGKAGAVYAVDIEFGAMYFTYSKTRWNTGELVYDELENESKWDGFDGTNNRVEIFNRSNAAVQYSVKPEISFLHSSIGDKQHGIRAKIYDVNATSGNDITNVLRTLIEATEGSARQFGQASNEACYLHLSGIPQFGEAADYTVVGQLTVTIRK